MTRTGVGLEGKSDANGIEPHDSLYGPDTTLAGDEERRVVKMVALTPQNRELTVKR